MDPSNPDDLALLLVQQFLQERNYTQALRETEKAHGLKFVNNKLPRGSMLLELVYDSMERSAAKAVGVGEAETIAEEEALMQGGLSDHPMHPPLVTVAGLHTANITAVCHCPGRDILFTGAGDGTVQAISFQCEELWRVRVGGGGAIALALHTNRNGDARLLAGSMDGSVSLLDGNTGAVLQSEKMHGKYVVRVRWEPDGSHFLSASWDGNLHVYSVTGSDAALHFSKVDSLPFPTAVQDVEFLPGGRSLVVALRDTNLLRVRKFPTIQETEESVNMNALGDHHVSFSARQLAVSPNGKYLLVSTDSPRILLLRIQGWTQLRVQIFGVPLDNFHSSVALWAASGFYIMAAAAAGQVYVFHVGTGKVATSFKAHEQNVRWLDYDAERNLLLTCSFDRTVKVFDQQAGRVK